MWQAEKPLDHSWILMALWALVAPGWTKGLSTEDWRYPLMARSLGIHDSCGPLYWLVVSLLGSHLVPTMLVWWVLGPVHKIWTGDSTPALGVLDVLAVCVSVAGIALQFLSDARSLRVLPSSQSANDSTYLEFFIESCGLEDRTLHQFRRKHVDLTSHRAFESQSCEAGIHSAPSRSPRSRIHALPSPQ